MTTTDPHSQYQAHQVHMSALVRFSVGFSVWCLGLGFKVMIYDLEFSVGGLWVWRVYDYDLWLVLGLVCSGFEG